jgi:hypothetical protein
MSRQMPDPPLAHRALATVVWVVLLAVHLPTAAALWLAARTLHLSDPSRGLRGRAGPPATAGVMTKRPASGEEKESRR